MPPIAAIGDIYMYCMLAMGRIATDVAHSVVCRKTCCF